MDNISIVDLNSGMVLDIGETGYFLLNANKTFSLSVGGISTADSLYKSYRQIGKTLTNKSIDTRPISVFGHVWGESKEILDANKSFLNSFVNPTHDYKIAFENGRYINFRPSTTTQYNTSYQDNNEIYAKFYITGYAYDPMVYEDEIVEISPFRLDKKFKFPLSFSVADPFVMGERVGLAIIIGENRGEMDVGAVFSFSASGACSKPKVTNVITQEYIEVNKTLAAGEKVIVDTRANLKSFKGIISGVEYNYYAYRSIGSSWIQIAIGENVFAISAASGVSNLLVDISFNQVYLGIE